MTLDKQLLELIVRELARHLLGHRPEINYLPIRGIFAFTNLLAEHFALHGGVARRQTKEGREVQATQQIISDDLGREMDRSEQRPGLDALLLGCTAGLHCDY